MRYWLNIFNKQTWGEFIQAGASVSGFAPHHWNQLQGVEISDRFICYLIGVSCFVGVLEITSAPFQDETPIFETDIYPCRVRVAPIIKLAADNGVPIRSLADRLSYFRNQTHPGAYGAFFRTPLRLVRDDDAAVIVAELEERARTPLELNPDVSIHSSPVPSDPDMLEPSAEPAEVREHTAIQRLLVELGLGMGLEVWVARNDKGKFQEFPQLRQSLPNQFDPLTRRTIEMIDVLWLKGNAIICAFEVEHTSSIYSGLLRMSDLMAMQPNLSIRLYLVAPDERKALAKREINRPTFALLSRPLTSVCKFIPYSSLRTEFSHIGGRMRYLRPEFIDSIAEELTIFSED